MSLFSRYLDFRTKVEEDVELEHQGSVDNGLLAEYRGPLISNEVGCFEVVEDLSLRSHSLSAVQLGLSQTEAGTCWRWDVCKKEDEGAKLFQYPGIAAHYRRKVELPAYQKVVADLKKASPLAVERIASKLKCQPSQVAHLIPSNGRPARFISGLVNFKTNTPLDEFSLDSLMLLETAFQKLDAGQAEGLEEYERDALKGLPEAVGRKLSDIRPKLPKLIDASRLRAQLLGFRVDETLEQESDIVEQFMPEPEPIAVFPVGFSLWLRKKGLYKSFLEEHGGYYQNGENLVRATRAHLNNHFSSEGGDRLFPSRQFGKSLPLFNGDLLEVPSFQEAQKAAQKAAMAIYKEYALWEKMSKLDSRAISLSSKYGEQGESEDDFDDFEEEDDNSEDDAWTNVGSFDNKSDVRPRPGIGSREPTPQSMPSQQEWIQQQVSRAVTPGNIMVLRALYGTLACEMPYSKDAQGQFTGHPFAFKMNSIMEALKADVSDYELGLVNRDVKVQTMLMGQSQRFCKNTDGKEFIMLCPVYESYSFREKWAELDSLQQFKLEDWVFICRDQEVEDIDEPMEPGTYYPIMVNKETHHVIHTLKAVHFPIVAVKSFQPGYVMKKTLRQTGKGKHAVWEALIEVVLEENMEGRQLQRLEQSILRLGQQPAAVFIDGEIHYRPFHSVYPIAFNFFLDALSKYEDGYEGIESLEGQDDLWAELSAHQESMRMAFLEPVFSGPLDAILTEIAPMFSIPKADLGSKQWGESGDQSFYQAHLKWSLTAGLLGHIKSHLAHVVAHQPILTEDGMWDENGAPFKTKLVRGSSKMKADAFGLGNGHLKESFQKQLETWVVEPIYSSQPRIWSPSKMPSRVSNGGVLGNLLSYAKAYLFTEMAPGLQRVWSHLECLSTLGADMKLAFQRLVFENLGDSTLQGDELARLLFKEFDYSAKMGIPMSMNRILNGVRPDAYLEQCVPHTEAERREYGKWMEERKKGTTVFRSAEIAVLTTAFHREAKQHEKDFEEMHKEREFSFNKRYSEKLNAFRKALYPYFETEQALGLRNLKSTMDPSSLANFKSIVESLKEQGVLKGLEALAILE